MAEPGFEPAGEGLYRVSGELTFATVTALLARSLPAFAAAPGGVVVDLSAVQRADSAGLALLVEWLRAARAVGGTVVFQSVPDQIRAMARVSNLEHLFANGNAAA